MFKIVITETKVEEVPSTREWKPTGNKNEAGGDEYSYTPQSMIKDSVERDILIQEVETLDLPAVIKAVNKIGE